MEFIMQAYFDQLDRVRFEGPKTENPLAFRHYNPDELVLGKRMEDHLRLLLAHLLLEWRRYVRRGRI
jgi:xylose isomerase